MSNHPAAHGRLFRSTFCANAAIACLSYFVVTLLALHVLRPDYAPRNHFISDYAVGEF